MIDQENKMTTNIMWNLSGNLVYVFCQWLMTVIVVKASNFNNAGILSLVMTITNVFTCFAFFGVRNFQVSDIKEKYSNGLYLWTRVTTCILSLLFCFIFLQTEHYDYYLKACIMCYMIYRIAEAFADVLHGIDQKLWRMDLIGKSFLMRGLIGICSFSIILYYTKNLLCSIIVMAFESAIVVFLFDLKSTKKISDLKMSFKYREILQLLITCMPLAIYSVLLTVIATIPRIQLEKILGTEELGIYASIASPILIIQVAVTYIFNPFATLFAEKYYSNKRKEFVKLLIQCILYICILSLLFLVGSKILGIYIYKLLYGRTIASHMYLLQPVIWSSIMTAMSWFLCMILTVLRELKGLLVSSIIATFTCSIFSYHLINLYGANGASYSLTIGFLIQIAISFAYVLKNIKFIKQSDSY